MDILIQVLNRTWWFLQAQGPDIFNTVAALVLGIPFALWTDRKLKEREGKSHTAENNARLSRALTVLESAITHNRQELAQVAQALATQQARIIPALDHSGWEACKSEVIPLLHDPSLQSKLAFYFSRIESFARANHMYLEYFIGIASALQGANQSREKLRCYLLGLAGNLNTTAAEILGDIANAKTQISGGGS